MLIICLTKVANNYTSLARCLGKIFKIEDLGFRALRSLGCTVIDGFVVKQVRYCLKLGNTMA